MSKPKTPSDLRRRARRLELQKSRPKPARKAGYLSDLRMEKGEDGRLHIRAAGMPLRRSDFQEKVEQNKNVVHVRSPHLKKEPRKKLELPPEVLAQIRELIKK